MLAENEEILFEASAVVLEDHDVVDALLQLFLVFLFKSVDVKYK